MKIQLIGEPKIILSNPTSTPNYFAWPTVDRLRDGRIAVAASKEQFCPPCGVCRQVLQEFAPELEVILVNSKGETMELTLKELLPYGFDSGNLK